MGNLGWIIAIANLCQVDSGWETVMTVDTHQRGCQKYYVKCIEDKLKTLNFTFETAAPSAWSGPLKECVLERK